MKPIAAIIMMLHPIFVFAQYENLSLPLNRTIEETISDSIRIIDRFTEHRQDLADPGDVILGIWSVEDNLVHVRIYRNSKSDTYEGIVEYMKYPLYNDQSPYAGTLKIDRYNPDSTLRNRPVLGMVLCWGFRFDPDDNRWEQGTIYNADNGKTYHSSIKYCEEKKTLKIRGSIDRFGLFGKNIECKKVTKEYSTQR